LDIAEGEGEELRLLYVALTRAQHQAVVWWAWGHKTSKAALTRLLFGTGNRLPDTDATARFAALGEGVSIERVTSPLLAASHRWTDRRGGTRPALEVRE